MRLPSWLSQPLAAVRALVVLTLLFGLAYPLAMVAVARIPGLSGSADGALKFWDLSDGQCLRTFQEHGEWVTAAGLSADGPPVEERGIWMQKYTFAGQTSTGSRKPVSVPDPNSPKQH